MNAPPLRLRSDRPFLATMIALMGAYVLLILALLVADLEFTDWASIRAAFERDEILYSLKLSLLSTTLASLLSLWVAVPTAYLLSRFRFRGRAVLEALLDVPIVLPPLVIGISLLILFASPVGEAVQDWVPVTYHVPSVVIAQFTVACAFAIRVMRGTFDEIDERYERVALTLGCNRGQAFWRVVLPQCGRGLVGAGTLAWARAMGEFGPILVFSGTIRHRTEILPTTAFLELSIGNLDAAVAVSMVMVTVAMIVLVAARLVVGGWRER